MRLEHVFQRIHAGLGAESFNAHGPGFWREAAGVVGRVLLVTAKFIKVVEGRRVLDGCHGIRGGHHALGDREFQAALGLNVRLGAEEAGQEAGGRESGRLEKLSPSHVRISWRNFGGHKVWSVLDEHCPSSSALQYPTGCHTGTVSTDTRRVKASRW